MTVGVLIGGVIAAFAPASIFKVAFVVIALLIGAKFLFGKDSWKLGDPLPGPFLMNVYGLIIGLYSALMGVGGGSVSNAILVFYGQTDPCRRRHRVRHRRADFDRRHDQLHDRRLAAPGDDAGVVDRLRVAASVLC